MFYLDSTAIYGYSSYETMDYSSLAELLCDMDRLGIHAALTINAVAARGHSQEGNRILMEDLEATPEARDRILPVFCVAPKNLYEKETMAYLHEHLSSGRVGALAIYPVVAKFHVHQIARIFEELKQYHPVVLVNCEELRPEQGYEQLAVIAKKFPEMTFVMRNSMWDDDGAIFDIMWRCENVLIENSRLHENGIIGNLIRNFGSGRVVFGRGYRSLRGASMASLAYSGISDEEKELVAGKRLLSLLPNRAEADRIYAAATERKAQIPNALWEELLAGKGIQSTEIIDAHTHLGGYPSNGWYSPTVGFDSVLELFLARAKEIGVKHILTSGIEALHGEPLEGNRYIQRKTAHCRDAISCYYVYNPRYAASLTDEELDARFAEGGFIGFKILASYWKMPADNPSYDPCWRYADRHRLPILFHCFGSGNTPEQIASVAAKYPNAHFILGHSGGAEGGRLSAETACLTYPNIYLEFCGSFLPRRSWRQTLDVVGADRVIFGSDTYVHDLAWELGRLLSENITDEELPPILAGNIKRLLAQRI